MFGNDVVVNIANATGLPDGNYQFNYSIPGGAPTGGTTPVIAIQNGIGQFTIPASLFANAGSQSLTIIGIVASAGGCTNANENAVVNFTLYPIPSITGATLSVLTTCPNYDSTATLTGVTALADGTYTILYNLSGANNAAAVSALVTVVGASAPL